MAYIILQIASEFLQCSTRQLLAPGYQEIWYSPDGARRSSSPATTVSPSGSPALLKRSGKLWVITVEKWIQAVVV